LSFLHIRVASKPTGEASMQQNAPDCTIVEHSRLAQLARGTREWARRPLRLAERSTEPGALPEIAWL
jgi:hypothetical protein